jgi:hypothetical protein
VKIFLFFSNLINSITTAFAVFKQTLRINTAVASLSTNSQPTKMRFYTTRYLALLSVFVVSTVFALPVDLPSLVNRDSTSMANFQGLPVHPNHEGEGVSLLWFERHAKRYVWFNSLFNSYLVTGRSQNQINGKWSGPHFLDGGMIWLYSFEDGGILNLNLRTAYPYTSTSQYLSPEHWARTYMSNEILNKKVREGYWWVGYPAIQNPKSHQMKLETYRFE